MGRDTTYTLDTGRISLHRSSNNNENFGDET